MVYEWGAGAVPPRDGGFGGASAPPRKPGITIIGRLFAHTGKGFIKGFIKVFIKGFIKRVY